mgnify:CR=1 FL=1
MKRCWSPSLCRERRSLLAAALLSAAIYFAGLTFYPYPYAALARPLTVLR